MKNKICTSVEQSKILISCEIDTTTADMHWEVGGHSGGKIIDGNRYLYFGCGCYEPEDKDTDIPAWSLPALLELLPTIKVSKNEEANPFIAKTPEGEYCVTYCTLYKEIESSKIYDDPIDACIDIITYFCQQGLM